MVLKPQDVAVLLKLAALGGARPTYSALAYDLRMSPSEVHACIRRARSARLLSAPKRVEQINIRNLKDLLFHGLPFVFVPERGSMTRGVPTAHAAPPMNGMILGSGEPPPVWPWPEGTVRGLSFSPLYRNAPAAALRDPKFYELLALTEALRDGRVRERDIARREIEKRFRTLE